MRGRLSVMSLSRGANLASRTRRCSLSNSAKKEGQLESAACTLWNLTYADRAIHNHSQFKVSEAVICERHVQGILLSYLTAVKLNISKTSKISISRGQMIQGNLKQQLCLTRLHECSRTPNTHTHTHTCHTHLKLHDQIWTLHRTSQVVLLDLLRLLHLEDFETSS